MNIVITGGTRGLGRALAAEFVRRGHHVTLSGRDAAAAGAAAAAMHAHGPGQAVGTDAEVEHRADVQALWDLARRSFGPVDLWLNNAGMTPPRLPFAEVAPAALARVVQTNLTGLLLGCRVALRGMTEQGSGRLFNVTGFGSDGLTQAGLSAYGATKRAVAYVTRALVKEYQATPLIIGSLDPGIVVTEFLTRDLYGHDPAALASRRRFLRLLADRPETMAPTLVTAMLAAARSGVRIRWMTPGKALGRLALAPFRSRDPFGSPPERMP